MRRTQGGLPHWTNRPIPNRGKKPKATRHLGSAQSKNNRRSSSKGKKGTKKHKKQTKKKKKKKPEEDTSRLPQVLFMPGRVKLLGGKHQYEEWGQFTREFHGATR